MLPVGLRTRALLAVVLTVALAVAVVVWIAGGSDLALAGNGSAADRARAVAAAAPSVDAATLDQTLTSQLNATLGTAADSWSMAALDLTSGRVLSAGASSGMYTGSIIKVELVETLLRVRGGPDHLDDGEKSTVEATIVNSDNDAATTVWSDAGGDDALADTGTLLGLTDTTIAPDGYFGVSTTSAADQIKVLQQLSSPTFLSVESAAYLIGLMQSVESDQRWGAPTVADPGTAAANKNGWLANDSDGDDWLINTLGIVTIGGHRVLLAVLSQHEPDFDTGVEHLDAAVAHVAAALKA